VTSTRLWVRCVHGLEDICRAELVVRLGAGAIEVSPRSILCDVDDPGGSTALQTADDAMVLAGRIDGIGSTKRDLRVLARGIVGLGLEVAAPVDVTASFVGRRTYNRYDIEDAVGEQLGRGYASRRDGGRPQDGGLHVRIHLEDETALVGVRVGDRPLHRRAYKTASVPGTLHPPVAAAMAVLGGLAPGDLVVDPTCGVGTICIEAATWHADVRSVGMDASASALAGARTNAAGAVALVRGDAGAAPLRSASADLVLTNPPWGRQADALGALQGGPDLLMAELRRITRDGGRIVVLAEEELPGLEPVTRATLSLMGARPTITVYGPEPPSPGSVLRSLLR
jgi:tRNA (guanine6-N2)-methyltransferase